MSRKLLKIPLDLIDEPSRDLRFYRDKAFSEILKRDLEVEGGLIIVPIVRPKNARYELIDGVERIRQLRRLGKRSVLCEVVEGVSDLDALVMGLKANIKRRSHDAMGVARVIRTMHERFNLRYSDIALRLGFSKGHVSKLMSLNWLAPKYQEMIAKGELSIAEGYQMASGRPFVDVEEFSRRKAKCEFCGVNYDSHEIELVRLCYRCRHDLTHLMNQRDKAIKRELEDAEKRRGQKYLDS